MIISPLIIEFIAKLFGVLRTTMNPYYLGPEQYGILGALSVYLSFSAFSDLGVLKEFESQLIHVADTFEETCRQTIRRLFWRITSFSVFVFLILQFTYSLSIAIAIAVYVFFFSLECLLQIIARVRKKYKILTYYLLLQASALTMGTWWVAPRWGVLGLMSMQACIMILGFFVLFMAFRDIGFHKFKLRKDSHSSSLKGAGQSSIWFLLGQVCVVLWLSADRFFLVHLIAPRLMGFWALGTVPVAFMVSMVNTLGMYRMVDWAKGKRRYLTESELALFTVSVGFGAFVFYFLVQHFLPLYFPTIGWNLRWINVNLGVSLIVYYDAYRRSMMESQISLQSQQWFWTKIKITCVSLLAFFFLASTHLDRREVIILGFHSLCLNFWIFEKKSKMFYYQLSLALLEVLIFFVVIG